MKAIVLSWLLLTACAATADPSAPWPQFRGPNGAGVADDATPPVTFGPARNLLWKTAAPGGVSSPIIQGTHVIMTGFASHQLVTVAFNLNTGAEEWRRVAPAEQIERCHEFSSPAASTPCTDGKRVFAYFNSFGVIAYDDAGREVWRRPLPALPAEYGSASSCLSGF